MGRVILKRFRQCSDEDLRIDQHIHSSWTDGTGSVEQILARAREVGLHRIAFTDHVRKASTYWSGYIREIRSLPRQPAMEVLLGFEAKILDRQGNLDIPPICQGEADLVIGSVHSLPGPDGFIPPGHVPPESLMRQEYELSLALIASGHADVLGHAGGMSLSTLGRFDPAYMEGILEACASAKTAFEINTRYHSGILPWLVERLLHYDPPVSLGSDAHRPEEVGNCALWLERVRREA